MPTNGRLPIFYPKHISLYRQCPERYFHEYVERRRYDQAIGPALAKGIAAHEVLGGVALAYERAIADRHAAALPIDLLPRVEGALRRDPYPSEAAWRLEVASLVEEVKYGVSLLDGEARVLASEATFQYPYERAEACPPFVLAAKVDLVLLRRDADGEPYLDVVDFKSGKSLKADPIQELAARIVVKQNAASRFGVEFAYVQSTTVYLGACATRSVVLDRDECGRRWQEVKAIVAAIIAGANWHPNPSPLCEWCPFFNDCCSLTPGGDGIDELGGWLDGAAD